VGGQFSLNPSSLLRQWLAPGVDRGLAGMIVAKKGRASWHARDGRPQTWIGKSSCI